MTFEYGIFDDDGDLRSVHPTIRSASLKAEYLGWGKIFKIKIETIGEEII